MEDAETRQIQDWLNALGNRELEANLMESGNARAWSKEYGDQVYVYYEEGRFYDEDHTRRLVGCVAIKDLAGLSPEESNNRLLDSAMAPVIGEGKAAEHLGALMGLNAYRQTVPKSKSIEAASYDGRFFNEMSRLTRLDYETISKLGLENFGNKPFRSSALKAVFLVSRMDLDNEWPALKYHIPRQKWNLRHLQNYEVLSLNGFTDPEYKANLIGNSGWTPVSYSSIVHICDKLAEQQQINSL